MSDGIIGHGTTLSIDGTAVGNIISVSGPDQTRNPVDISTMDSPAKWMEFIPGLLDGGEITLEVNYDGTAAGTGNFLNSQLTAAASIILVTWPAQGTSGTSSWSSSGFMTGLGTQTPHDDKITQSVTIKASGQPTYTDSAT